MEALTIVSLLSFLQLTADQRWWSWFSHSHLADERSKWLSRSPWWGVSQAQARVQMSLASQRALLPRHQIHAQLIPKYYSMLSELIVVQDYVYLKIPLRALPEKMRISAVAQVRKDETHRAKLWGAQSCHTPFSLLGFWIQWYFLISFSFVFLLLRNSLTFL